MFLHRHIHFLHSASNQDAVSYTFSSCQFICPTKVVLGRDCLNTYLHNVHIKFTKIKPTIVWSEIFSPNDRYDSQRKSNKMQQRPETTRPSTLHVCKTRGCQCSFRLLIMGGVLPETCWASDKYEIKIWYTVASCWIIYVNYTMMHGSTNIKIDMTSATWIPFPHITVTCSNYTLFFMKMVKQVGLWPEYSLGQISCHFLGHSGLH